MAVRGAGNITVVYNAVDITAYLNSAELANAVAELEGTQFGFDSRWLYTWASFVYSLWAGTGLKPLTLLLALML